MSKTSTHNHGSQDFLTQLQDAEVQVEASIDKARKKAVSDLQAYRKKAEAKKQADLDAARVKAKDKIKERQTAARSRYEDAVAEGKREVKNLEKEVEPKIEKQLSVAQSFFVNEILG